VTLLALIRHMPTEWNAAGVLQGRGDLPLALDLTPDWRLPTELDGFAWLTSPLRRAVETARRLGVCEAIVEPRLTEMAWGEWQGTSLAALRARLGAEMALAEAAGLDFRPPGGESPREVQVRIEPLLAEIARSGRPTAAITHKGVIRAVLALATGWDMRDKPPHRLSWAAAQLFRLDPAGRPAVERLNLPLERA
jgi:broad specificity phosphatase PhoE